MNRLVTAVFLVLPVLPLAGQDEETVVPIAKKDSGAMSLLPVGSVLDHVMLPQYGKDQILTEVVRADRMIVRAPQVISGEKVSVDFYNNDQTPRGRIELATARFNQENGVLRSDDPAVIRTTRFSASGTGIYYASKQMKGFLLGPARSRLYSTDSTTSMNVSKPLRATAFFGISLMPLLSAAPVPEAASQTESVQAQAQKNRDELRGDLARSVETTQQITTFLDEADLIAKQPSSETVKAEVKPLDVAPGAKDTVVDCDGGIYYDSKNGVLVYLRNVVVKDARFDLSGADELKIYFTKKPEKEASKKESAEPSENSEKKRTLGPQGDFGDVEKIVATGAVRVLKKSDKPGEAPIEASGTILTYHVKTGDIVITGGFPWVKQGDRYTRALRANETLRLYGSGEFVTEGKWQMGAPLQQR